MRGQWLPNRGGFEGLGSDYGYMRRGIGVGTSLLPGRLEGSGNGYRVDSIEGVDSTVVGNGYGAPLLYAYHARLVTPARSW